MAWPVALTGGPDSQSGEPPGTVWCALVGRQQEKQTQAFDGDLNALSQWACREVVTMSGASLGELTGH